MSVLFVKRARRETQEDPLFSLTSLPGNVIEKLMLEILFRDMENKKAIKNGHHGFTKEKSYLSNLITSSNKLNRLIVEGRAVDIVNLSGESFDVVSHKIFIWEQMKNGLDENTVNGAQNSLNVQAQRVVNSGMKCGWRSAASSVPQKKTVRLFSVVFRDGRRDNMHRLRPGRLSEDREPLFHCKGGRLITAAGCAGK